MDNQQKKKMMMLMNMKHCVGHNGYRKSRCCRMLIRYKRLVAVGTFVMCVVFICTFISLSGLTMEFTSLPKTWKQKAEGFRRYLHRFSNTQTNVPTTASSVSTPPAGRETTQTSHKLNDTEIAARFEARRQLLQQACKRYSESLRSKYFKTKIVYIPADRSGVFNVTYCAIPKTASTTWKKIFKSMKAALQKNSSTGGTTSGLAKDERKISFTFIREPYGRLLSAYVDKLFSPNGLFSKIIGRYIIKNFRPNASKRSRRCGFDVTFPEYIRYFIHMQKTRTKRDEHFVPAHEHCHICDYPYTYLGHLETIKEDMPFILKAMHSPVAYNKTFDNLTIVSNSHMVLQKTRKKLQDCVDLDEASRRLWKKWQIRGIVSKSLTFPLTREETRNISARRMSKAGLAALARSGPRGDRIGQKKEALREAFASISMEERVEVKRLLFPGFEMFGFDPEPDEVFPHQPYEADTHFSYFDLYR